MNQQSRQQMKVSEPGSSRLVATLGLAGLLSGLIIVSVFEATLPTITAYKAKVLQEAVFKVLPGSTQLQRLVYRDGRLTPVEEVGKGEEFVFGGQDAQGVLVGYAIPGSGPGFQDTIRLLYGYQPKQRKVVGMEILESRETPGLGDKIYKDAEFVSNFDALSVEPEIVTVKRGAKAAPNEVDAITGATISSKAVVRIINQANQQWLQRF
ncbi:MAG: FMN-binding protein [Candidatus Thiodiazotropha sp. (ex Lucina aurantia)]|nr:FMN-binding protein [Candidatus Thiodiazotropha endolucinida]MBT3014382.1 FMN-binding protein [Candidatus Thiodiazotropha taylori]MBT3029749.1 FMN-binding protein [Candidatus Thiodiazotropha sp. (ex Lucina pensylvanica)]MBT3038080.1 FMN-binding protein [Candidatus Thiodiazotropha sp. (ex Codakia orbicularis)]MBV2102321.1 FMN-binding protein [Candidatus Thiodiazotropha sp. (ex Lucina aurantia)]MBT3021920.1 FMN-binding protein [Candidatus Thiodiazotropha taylori]